MNVSFAFIIGDKRIEML